MAPQSYPVSAQAVALGGNPLVNETATVAAEDENRSKAQGPGWNTRSRVAASPKATGGHLVAARVCALPHPSFPHRIEQVQHGSQDVHGQLVGAVPPPVAGPLALAEQAREHVEAGPPAMLERKLRKAS